MSLKLPWTFNWIYFWNGTRRLWGEIAKSLRIRNTVCVQHPLKLLQPWQFTSSLLIWRDNLKYTKCYIRIHTSGIHIQKKSRHLLLLWSYIIYSEYCPDQGEFRCHCMLLERMSWAYSATADREASLGTVGY
jgi:hypothetical protein